MNKGRKAAFWIIVLAILGVVIAFALYKSGFGQDKNIVYKDKLDEAVLNVDGSIYKLRDLAFYIAYEETEVEKKAEIYDATDTSKYWNLHTNGEFVRLVAGDAIIDMKVHDIIFYEKFLEEGLELTKDEEELFKGKLSDFWYDLSDEQKEKLGVSKAEIKDQMYQAACAEKYQHYAYEHQDTFDYDDFDMNGYAYKRMLEEEGHTYEVYDIWDGLSIGDITLTHKEIKR